MTEHVPKLRSAAALAALAHPARARILDALQVDGPSTASALADRTDQAIGSASHHLKVLAEAGLVEEAPELARDRRERWWRLVTRSWKWNRSDVEDQAAYTASLAAESLQLQRQFVRTRSWLDEQDETGPWNAAAFATTMWLRLSPDELAELATELQAVLRRWHARDVSVDDGQQRESVYLFARGFPSQP